MVTCAIKGCKSATNKDKVGFFGVPSEIRHQCSLTAKLSIRRRELWLARINRGYFDRKAGRNVRVCGKHFIQGHPAKLFEETDPDWTPSLNLDHQDYSTPSTSATRNKRSAQTSVKKETSEHPQSSKFSRVVCRAQSSRRKRTGLVQESQELERPVSKKTCVKAHVNSLAANVLKKEVPSAASCSLSSACVSESFNPSAHKGVSSPLHGQNILGLESELSYDEIDKPPVIKCEIDDDNFELECPEQSNLDCGDNPLVPFSACTSSTLIQTDLTACHLDVLRAENSYLVAEVSSLQSDNKRLSEKVSCLEKQCGSLTKENISMRNELKQLRSGLQNLLQGKQSVEEND